jgi:4-amino-4-deoxy-L-arabinose transferase-like glycosyltransferase
VPSGAATPTRNGTASAGRVTGDELWRLRLVQVLISYGLALAVFALLHRRLALGQGQSPVLSLLFVLSPYVCGTPFRLMTDNLAILFSVLSIDRLERFRERHRLGQFGLAGACVAVAVLTRQSTAFMLGVAGLYALGARIPIPVRALAAAAVGLAAIPAAALFLNWHGLVPPGGTRARAVCVRPGAREPAPRRCS